MTTPKRALVALLSRHHVHHIGELLVAVLSLTLIPGAQVQR